MERYDKNVMIGRKTLEDLYMIIIDAFPTTGGVDWPRFIVV